MNGSEHLERSRQAKKVLRSILVGQVSNVAIIEMIVHDAGMDPSKLNFSGSAELVWYAVIEDAVRSGKLGCLLNEVPNLTWTRDLDKLVSAITDGYIYSTVSRRSGSGLPGFSLSPVFLRWLIRKMMRTSGVGHNFGLTKLPTDEANDTD